MVRVPRMADTFVRTLTSVINGTHQLENFASIIVGAAVEDALLCVARDYGHNYTTMVDRYRDALVDRHAMAGSGNSMCLAQTAGGSRCTRRAVCKGYCRMHASQAENDESKAKIIRVHQRSHATSKDGVESSLRTMGVRIVPSSSWLIRARDTTDLI